MFFLFFLFSQFLVHSEGDQPWDLFGRNDAKAETPVLWPPHAKSWLIGKDSDASRDWGQEEKRTTEDKMAGWHHRLNRSEFEWTQGVGDGQGGLACCSSWGRKESDTTEQLNWTELGSTPIYEKNEIVNSLPDVDIYHNQNYVYFCIFTFWMKDAYFKETTVWSITVINIMQNSNDLWQVNFGMSCKFSFLCTSCKCSFPFLGIFSLVPR